MVQRHGHYKLAIGGDWMPSIIDAMQRHTADKVVWPCLQPRSHQSDRIILHWEQLFFLQKQKQEQVWNT